MYYFKYNDGGVGISNNQNVEDVAWITKKEFDALVIENEKKLAEEAAATALEATEEDYLEALAELGVE